MSWDALLQYIVLGDEAFTELQAENARLREALEAYIDADFVMGGTSAKADAHNKRLQDAMNALGKEAAPTT
jgi:hypothetical protein